MLDFIFENCIVMHADAKHAFGSSSNEYMITVKAVSEDSDSDTFRSVLLFIH